MIRKKEQINLKNRQAVLERKKGMALSQIIILVLGTIAIAYALGDGVKEVSADPIFSNVPIFRTQPSTIPVPTILDIAKAADVTGIAGTQTGGSATAPVAGGAEPAKTKILGLIEVEGPWGTIVNGVIQIGANAGIAYGLYQLSKWGLSLIPNIDVSLAEMISQGIGWGYLVGSTLVTVAQWIWGASTLGWFAGPLGIIIGGAIGAFGGAIIGFLFYKKTMQEAYIFNCYSWMPAMGSASICRQCGQNGLPCSKYECQSLGQGCKYLNENTGLATCDYVGKNDVKPPEIKPWREVLLENYMYNPDTTISPPDKGVSVDNTASDDGCTDYYTPISFGVSLDRPAMCKYTLDTREDSYENMPDLFLPSSNGLSTYNHSIVLSIPDLTGEEGTVPVSESGEHELFVRCKGENGVSSPINYVFKFCISKQPDTSAPEIILTNPLNGFPITSGTTSTKVDVYLNEPSDCKWSHTTGQTYDTMAGTMTCTSTADKNMLYQCSGTLDGLTSSTNKFYFKCKDRSVNQNTMPEDYPYTLLGTQPLVIDSVGPTGIIKGSSNKVQVTLTARTSSGYKEGAANCLYNRRCWSNTGSTESYTLFNYPANTKLFSAYQHSQDLFLPAGTYTCSIKCMDIGGNADIETTTYSVEVDQDAPIVARVYNEDNLLKIVTNEKAECVYDILDCNYNFGDGTAMTDSEDGLSHTTSWNTRNNLYIKCKDDYDNQPASGTCNIVVRAISII
jgi:hypothetical protein